MDFAKKYDNIIRIIECNITLSYREIMEELKAELFLSERSISEHFKFVSEYT